MHLCCCEIAQAVAKLEGTGALCITEHDGFDAAVCLNRYECCKQHTISINSNMENALTNQKYMSKSI